jgi:hypothetical protein
VRRAGWIILLLLVGVVAYHLPWIGHSTAGWTMHAYDFAEWTSLHPAVRGSSPPLFTSYLLRMPQAALVIALALATGGLRDARLRWLGWGFAALLALRFLPPTEFFTGAGGDPNYRQMLLLTGLGLVGVGVGALLGRRSGRWAAVLLALALAKGAVAGWWGLSRADALLGHFEIQASVGAGPVLLTLASAAAATLALIPVRRPGAGPGRDKKKGG